MPEKNWPSWSGVLRKAASLETCGATAMNGLPRLRRHSRMTGRWRRSLRVGGGNQTTLPPGWGSSDGGLPGPTRRRRLRARRRRKGGHREPCGERHPRTNRRNSCGRTPDFACTAIQLLTRSGANQFVNGWLTIAAAFSRWARWIKKLARDRVVNRQLSMMWRVAS